MKQQKRHTLERIIAGTLVLTVMLLGVAFITSWLMAAYLPQKAPLENHPEITLYFLNEKHPNASLDCGATLPVKRKVLGTANLPDTAMRLLLQGPTPQEEKQGFSANAFYDLSWTNQQANHLKEYYQGVSVQNGVAIVDFAPPALTYLNATVCIQAAVKGPIYDTLINLPDITDIQFSIDGEVFEEWDA